jgi:hypothetical protein
MCDHSKPTTDEPQQMQPLNPDFNFETYGLDLNSLWGDITEWDMQV